MDWPSKQNDCYSQAEWHIRCATRTRKSSDVKNWPREQKGGFREWGQQKLEHGAQVCQCLIQSGCNRNSYKYKRGRQTAKAIWKNFIKGPQDFGTFLMRTDILPSCVSVCHMHAWCHWGPDKGTGAPGTEITDGCELPCVLGIKPRASVRPATAHNCWVIAPTPWKNVIPDTQEAVERWQVPD